MRFLIFFLFIKMTFAWICRENSYSKPPSANVYWPDSDTVTTYSGCNQLEQQHKPPGVRFSEITEWELIKRCAAGALIDEETSDVIDTASLDDIQECKTLLDYNFTNATFKQQIIRETCRIGYYLGKSIQESCENCPSGYEQPMNNSFECIECPSGFFRQRDDATGCEKCPDGWTQPVPKGACQKCIQGFFTNIDIQKCQQCPRGYYQNQALQTNCIKCPSGQYQPNAQQTSCEECAEGQYRPDGQDIAIQSCLSCPEGFSQDKQAQNSCEPCEAGSYQDDPNRNECKTCPSGKYQTFKGQSHCVECSRGQYSTTEGNKIPCIPCSSGRYQELNGASFCAQCPKGWTTDPLESTISCFRCQERPLFCGQCNGYGNNTSRRRLDLSITVSVIPCQECTPGRYSNMTNDCVLCPSGFISEQGAEECTKCPTNTFANETFSICEQCPAGYISTIEDIECKPCQLGKYRSIFDTECQTCPDGFEIVDEQCQLCQKGKFHSKTTFTCENCPNGKFSILGGTSCVDSCPTDLSPPTENACAECPSNQQFTDNTCSECPSNSYRMKGQFGCKECSSGKYMPDKNENTECIFCENGTFLSNTNECKECPPGKNLIYSIGTTPPVDENGDNICSDCSVGMFKTTEGEQCQECPLGFYQQNIGQISCETCPGGYISNQVASIQCDECPAGYGEDGGTCNPCSEDEITISGTCQTCPQGKYKDLKECEECPIGQYGINDECHDCEDGKYQDQEGQTDCKTCAKHDFSPYMNSIVNLEGAGSTFCVECLDSDHLCWNYTLSSDCNDDRNCIYDQSPEYIAETTNYCLFKQENECKDQCQFDNNVCQPKTFCKTNVLTREACQQCSAGSFFSTSQKCEECPIGQISTIGAVVCRICPTGTIDVGRKKCELCPVGKYVGQAPPTEMDPDTGAPIIFKRFVSGGTCNELGYADITTEKDCKEARSYFSEKEPDINIDKTDKRGCWLSGTTLFFGPGKQSRNADDVSELLCSTGPLCVNCPAGFYQDLFRCEECPLGFYQDTSGNDDCKQCTGVSTTNEKKATDVNQCQDCKEPFQIVMNGICQTCPQRTQFNNQKNECEICPDGYFGPGGGQPCQICSIGKTSKGGEMCITCPGGRFADSPGLSECKECPTENIPTFCSVCAAGKFGQPRTKCRDCEAGKWSLVGETNQCSVCSCGRYQPETGQDSCLDCQGGKYSDEKGQVICKDCPIGKFQPDVFAGACLKCSKGTYQPNIGQEYCFECPLGRFTDSDGSSKKDDCKDCPAGFLEENGVCLKCPEKTYQPNIGQINCLNCPSGWLSKKGSTNASECFSKKGLQTFVFGMKGDSKPISSSVRKCEIRPNLVMLCPGCSCNDDSRNGFWDGPICDECRRGFATTTCTTKCPAYDGAHDSTICNGNGFCWFGKFGNGLCYCGSKDTIDSTGKNVVVDVRLCPKGQICPNYGIEEQPETNYRPIYYIMRYRQFSVFVLQLNRYVPSRGNMWFERFPPAIAHENTCSSCIGPYKRDIMTSTGFWNQQDTYEYFGEDIQSKTGFHGENCQYECGLCLNGGRCSHVPHPYRYSYTIKDTFQTPPPRNIFIPQTICTCSSLVYDPEHMCCPNGFQPYIHYGLRLSPKPYTRFTKVPFITEIKNEVRDHWIDKYITLEPDPKYRIPYSEPENGTMWVANNNRQYVDSNDDYVEIAFKEAGPYNKHTFYGTAKELCRACPGLFGKGVRTSSLLIETDMKAEDVWWDNAMGALARKCNGIGVCDFYSKQDESTTNFFGDAETYALYERGKHCNQPPINGLQTFATKEDCIKYAKSKGAKWIAFAEPYLGGQQNMFLKQSNGEILYRNSELVAKYEANRRGSLGYASYINGTQLLWAILDPSITEVPLPNSDSSFTFKTVDTNTCAAYYSCNTFVQNPIYNTYKLELGHGQERLSTEVVPRDSTNATFDRFDTCFTYTKDKQIKTFGLYATQEYTQGEDPFLGGLCPKGHFCTQFDGIGFKEACPPGYYQPKQGISRTHPETQCSQLTTMTCGCQPNEATADLNDYIDNVCIRCPRNWYAPKGSAECTECPNGKVKKVSGKWVPSNRESDKIINIPTWVFENSRPWYYIPNEGGTETQDCALVPAGVIHVPELNDYMNYDQPDFLAVAPCPLAYSSRPGTYVFDGELEEIANIMISTVRAVIDTPYSEFNPTYSYVESDLPCDYGKSPELAKVDIGPTQWDKFLTTSGGGGLTAPGEACQEQTISGFSNDRVEQGTTVSVKISAVQDGFTQTSGEQFKNLCSLMTDQNNPDRKWYGYIGFICNDGTFEYSFGTCSIDPYSERAKCSSITDHTTFCSNYGNNGLKDDSANIACKSSSCELTRDGAACCKLPTCNSITDPTTFCVDHGNNGLKDNSANIACKDKTCEIRWDGAACCKPAPGAATCNSITDHTTFCNNYGNNGLKDNSETISCATSTCNNVYDGENCCKQPTCNSITDPTFCEDHGNIGLRSNAATILCTTSQCAPERDGDNCCANNDPGGGGNTFDIGSGPDYMTGGTTGGPVIAPIAPGGPVTAPGGPVAAPGPAPVGCAPGFGGYPFCVPCPAGYYQAETSINNCKQCFMGQYAISSTSSSCTSCTGGKYQPRLFANSYGAETCKTCGAGKYALNSASLSCLTCGSGKYHETSENPEYSCKTCGRGRYASSVSSACSDCPSGRYNDLDINPGHSCKTCGVGQFAQSSTVSFCSACVDGKYQDQNIAPEYTSSACKTCGAGQFAESAEVACKVCGEGRYSDQTPNPEYSCNPHTYCGKQLDGTSRLEGHTTTSAGSCAICKFSARLEEENDTNDCLCPPGMGSNGQICVQCSSPTYNDAWSDKTQGCADMACPFGKGVKQIADGFDATSGDENTNCESCPSGEYSDSDTTGQCKPIGSGYRGTDKNGVFVESEAVRREPCPQKTFSSSGGGDCIGVAQGYLPVDINGNYVEFGAVGQEPCPAGSYSGGGGDCKTCGPGMYAESSTATECVFCLAGRYSDEVANPVHSCKPHTICNDNERKAILSDASRTSPGTCSFLDGLGCVPGMEPIYSASAVAEARSKCKEALKERGIHVMKERVAPKGCWFLKNRPSVGYFGIGIYDENRVLQESAEVYSKSVTYLCEASKSNAGVAGKIARNYCFKCPGDSITGPGATSCVTCSANKMKHYLKEAIRIIADGTTREMYEYPTNIGGMVEYDFLELNRGSNRRRLALANIQPWAIDWNAVRFPNNPFFPYNAGIMRPDGDKEADKLAIWNGYFSYGHFMNYLFYNGRTREELMGNVLMYNPEILGPIKYPEKLRNIDIRHMPDRIFSVDYRFGPRPMSLDSTVPSLEDCFIACQSDSIHPSLLNLPKLPLKAIGLYKGALSRSYPHCACSFGGFDPTWGGDVYDLFENGNLVKINDTSYGVLYEYDNSSGKRLPLDKNTYVSENGFLGDLTNFVERTKNYEWQWNVTIGQFLANNQEITYPIYVHSKEECQTKTMLHFVEYCQNDVDVLGNRKKPQTNHMHTKCTKIQTEIKDYNPGRICDCAGMWDGTCGGTPHGGTFCTDYGANEIPKRPLKIINSIGSDNLASGSLALSSSRHNLHSGHELYEKRKLFRHALAKKETTKRMGRKRERMLGSTCKLDSVNIHPGHSKRLGSKFHCSTGAKILDGFLAVVTYGGVSWGPTCLGEYQHWLKIHNAQKAAEERAKEAKRQAEQAIKGAEAAAKMEERTKKQSEEKAKEIVAEQAIKRVQQQEQLEKRVQEQNLKRCQNNERSAKDLCEKANAERVAALDDFKTYIWADDHNMKSKPKGCILQWDGENTIAFWNEEGTAEGDLAIGTNYPYISSERDYALWVDNLIWPDIEETIEGLSYTPVFEDGIWKYEETQSYKIRMNPYHGRILEATNGAKEYDWYGVQESEQRWDVPLPLCMDCQPGKYSNGPSDPCKDCPLGYYSSKARTRECLECPGGRYSDSPGMTLCLICPPGKMNEGNTCIDCDAGKYNSGDLIQCVSCPRGFYQTDIGKARCESCPVGFFQWSSGRQNCKECLEGQFGPVPGMGECKNCPAGYKDKVDSKITCEECPSGKYQAGVAASQCINCQKGKYSEQIARETPCESCEAGKWQNDTGKTFCYDCRGGIECRVDGYGNSCGGGKYLPALTHGKCISCAKEKGSVMGGTACDWCPNGRSTFGSSGSSCKQCTRTPIETLAPASWGSGTSNGEVCKLKQTDGINERNSIGGSFCTGKRYNYEDCNDDSGQYYIPEKELDTDGVWASMQTWFTAPEDGTYEFSIGGPIRDIVKLQFYRGSVRSDWYNGKLARTFIRFAPDCGKILNENGGWNKTCKATWKLNKGQRGSIKLSCIHWRGETDGNYANAEDVGRCSMNIDPRLAEPQKSSPKSSEIVKLSSSNENTLYCQHPELVKTGYKVNTSISWPEMEIPKDWDYPNNGGYQDWRTRSGAQGLKRQWWIDKGHFERCETFTTAAECPGYCEWRYGYKAGTNTRALQCEWNIWGQFWPNIRTPKTYYGDCWYDPETIQRRKCWYSPYRDRDECRGYTN